MAEKLAIKKYYQQLIDEKQQEIKILNNFISQYEKISFKSDAFLAEDSAYYQLLQKYFQTNHMQHIQWMQEACQTNTKYPEHLIHKTIDGKFVRSKSEVIIANALYMNQIPYRYESELKIQNISYYPDFTILHPSTQKIIYWEHFGMMDKSSYANHVFDKMKNYVANGMIPSINLITTYETMETPIDSDKIQKIITEYFL